MVNWPGSVTGRGRIAGVLLVVEVALLLVAAVATVALTAAAEGASAAGAGGASESLGSAAAPALWFDRNTISVKPEYDRGNRLIVDEGTLTNRSTEPYSGKISFYAPKGADIQMACEIAANGDHNCQFYQVEDKGDHIIVSWQLARPLQPGGRLPVYFEYYYGPSPGAKLRNVNFAVAQQFPADAVEIVVTPPLRSSAYQSQVRASTTSEASGGFTNYYYNLGPKNAGQTVGIEFAYEKGDSRPSAPPKSTSQGGGQGSGAATTRGSVPPEERSGLANPGVAAAVVVLIALFAVGLYLVVKRGGAAAKPASKPAWRTVSGSVLASAKSSTKRSAADEKAKARELLLEGKISEKTYQRLISDIENPNER